MVFHIDDRRLLTGDTLHWNHRRSELDVFAGAMFHSWEVLALYQEQMGRLGPAMRDIGRAGRSDRPQAAYVWF